MRRAAGRNVRTVWGAVLVAIIGILGVVASLTLGASSASASALPNTIRPAPADSHAALTPGSIDRAVSTAQLPSNGAIDRAPDPNISYPCLQTCGLPETLTYHGGPVMGSTVPCTSGHVFPTTTATCKGDITVYPIFWDPTPTTYPYAPTYKRLVDQYLSDVAATSGKPTNVFATDQQYYQTVSGTKEYIRYTIHYGGTITITTPFPSAGCELYGPSETCLTPQQLLNEIASPTHSFTFNLSNLYLLYLPTNVRTCTSPTTGGKTCSGVAGYWGDYCAYHSYGTVVATGNTVIYAIMPYPFLRACNSPGTGSTTFYPNGTPYATYIVKETTHEMNEAITDPLVNAWLSVGLTATQHPHFSEMADECDNQFGTLTATTGIKYNQTINGHHYRTQLLFSDQNYELTGTTKGCIPYENRPTTVIRVLGKSARVGFPIWLTAAASSNPNGPTKLTKYKWTFGDGSTPLVTTKPTVTHTYAASGTYTVTLTVRTLDGWTGSTQGALHVTTKHPDASGTTYAWTSLFVYVYPPGTTAECTSGDCVGTAEPERIIYGNTVCTRTPTLPCLYDISDVQENTLTDTYSLYVSSSEENSILIYPAGAGVAYTRTHPTYTHPAKPTCTIKGTKTRLTLPLAMWLEPTDSLVVENVGGTITGVHVTGSVEVFAPESCGNVAPVRYIAGPATDIRDLDGVATNATFDIFVANNYLAEIEEFTWTEFTPTRATKKTKVTFNVAPKYLINDAQGFPTGISIGFNGELYVVNGDGETGHYVPTFYSVEAFPPLTASSPVQLRTVEPLWVIKGDTTRLTCEVATRSSSLCKKTGPMGIAVDATGNIYVNDPSSSLHTTIPTYGEPDGSTGGVLEWKATVLSAHKSGTVLNVAPSAAITAIDYVENTGVSVADPPPTTSVNLFATTRVAMLTQGSSTSATATLVGDPSPTGSIVFKLFGPNNSTCTLAPAHISTPVPVTGDGTYTSPSYMVTSAGTYDWQAVYSGDAHNAAITTPCSEPGETVTVTVPVTIPSAPTNVHETAKSPTSVSLAWTAPSSNGGTAITHYLVYNTDNTGSLLAIFGPTTPSGIVSGLTPGTTYDFTVKAENEVGASTPSNALSITTTKTAPSAPIDVHETAQSGESVSFAWRAPASNGGTPIDHYLVYKTGTILVATVGATTLAYTVGGLAPGTTYNFTVEAENSTGTSAASNTLSVTTTAITTPTAPSAPANLHETAKTHTSVSLAWTAPASNGGTAITHYLLYKTGTTLVATLGATTLAYTVGSVAPGTTYHFTVKAENLTGTSTPSNTVAVTTTATVPSAPTNLRETAKTHTSVSLAWTAPSSNGGTAITHYLVFATAIQVATLGPTVLSDTVSGLTPGATYHFTLKAENKIGTSTPSTTVAVTTTKTAPSAPTNLHETAKTHTSVSLAWTAPSSNGGTAIDHYLVDKTGALLATLGATTLSYKATGLSSGVTYHFTVKAENSTGTSTPSNTVAVSTTKTAPSPPTDLHETAKTPTSVSLAWTAPTSNGGTAITHYLAYKTGTLVATLGATTLTSKATGLSTGITYHFTVKAENSTGTSTPSNTVAVTTTSVGKAPKFTSTATAYFELGRKVTFAISATGTPTPSITETGRLPAGLHFAATGTGNATISGSPFLRALGTHHVVLTAKNTVGTATQTLTIVVGFPPTFVTPRSVTFTVGSHKVFTVSTIGYPAATLHLTGTLPKGLAFTPEGSGSATIAGSPAAGTGGRYHLMVTAQNAFGEGVEHLVVVVDQPPAFTSGASATFTPKSSNGFAVTTSGYPAASIKEAGTLPKGVGFKTNGNGTATISGTPTTSKATAYKLKLIATNGVGKAATQTFTLTVS